MSEKREKELDRDREIKLMEDAISKTPDGPEKDKMIKLKKNLEVENKFMKMIEKYRKTLQEIIKNDEEYKILLERKKLGDLVENLIKQNRNQAEILKKLDKENCEEGIKWGQSEEAKNFFEEMDRWLRMNPIFAIINNIKLNFKKNEEEYKELVERKNKGEYVDDLIKQNRYNAEILVKEKKNWEETMKEVPSFTEAVQKSQKMPKETLMTLENLGEEKKKFYDTYKNMIMLEVEHLESLIKSIKEESRKKILIKKVFELKYELSLTSYALVLLSLENKPHDVKVLSKGQEKEAQKIIDLVIKGLKLKNPPDYEAFGRKRRKGEKEDNLFYKRDIKLVFNFKDHLKKLIYNLENIYELLKNSYSKLDWLTQDYLRKTFEQNLWTGVLDFPISQAFLFGRVVKQVQHGGGTYCFVPFDHKIINIGHFKEEWEERRKIMENYIKSEMAKDFIFKEIEKFNNLYNSMENIIENYLVIRLLNQFRSSSDAITSMKERHEFNYFIYQLNDDRKLIKLLKKISHFGNTEYRSFPFHISHTSDCDVSILFFPYQNNTIFQVCDFMSYNKYTIPAIKALIEKVIDISKI